jgi:hypothetical protein
MEVESLRFGPRRAQRRRHDGPVRQTTYKSGPVLFGLPSIDWYSHIAVVMPFYLQRRFRIIDVFIAYIFAGPIVNLRVWVFVDV